MLSHLALIRAFEEYVLELAGQGLIHGPAHSSIGQEGGAVGSVLASDERRTPSTARTAAITSSWPRRCTTWRPRASTRWPTRRDDIRTVLLRSLAEICGLSRGFCRGRGGSMHLQWHEAGAIGTNAIVGGGVPLAAGYAWAHRQAGTDAVAVTYFGDGAINIGSTLETFNLAAAWKLPICFFIENNHYAVSTTVDEATGEPRLSARGLGFNIPSWRVDGMDPLAVHLAMQEAVAAHAQRARPDDDRGRHLSVLPPERRLPRQRVRLPLQGRREVVARPRPHPPARRSSGATQHPHHRRDRRHDRAGPSPSWPNSDRKSSSRCPAASPGNAGSNRPSGPTPASATSVCAGIFRSSTTWTSLTATSFSGAIEQRKFVEAIAAVLGRQMEVDPSVVIMGEDIHRLNGGTNGATRGLDGSASPTGSSARRSARTPSPGWAAG